MEKSLVEYGGKQSSLEVSKTTKGYTWKIKLYFDDAQQPFQHVIEDAAQMDNLMKQKFGEVA